MSIEQAEGTCNACGEVKSLIQGTCTDCQLDVFDLSVEAEEPPPYPELPEAALYGLPGHFVRQLAPYTEAHRAALLVDYLASFGTFVGRGPSFYYGQVMRAKLFVAVIGLSAKARKSTTRRLSKLVFGAVDEQFARERIVSGNTGSGQGVLELLRDEETDREGRHLRGTVDQRLLLYLAELSGTFKVSDKAESLLSEIVRQAWDDDTIRLIRREDPACSSLHHLSIIGNIVGSELFRVLSSTDTENGFANRFLYCLAFRENFIARPKAPPTEIINQLVVTTRAAAQAARKVREMDWEEEAGELWDNEYPRLTVEEEGPLGAMTGRADTHPVRLAMIYALTDGSRLIRPEHLEAGLALWDYCDASLRYVWSRWGGNAAMVKGMDLTVMKHTEFRANTVLTRVTVGAFLSKSALSAMFSRNVPKGDLETLMGEFCRRGLFKSDMQVSGTAGRPAQGWRRVQ